MNTPKYLIKIDFSRACSISLPKNKTMMNIRKMTKEDIQILADIWLKTSFKAHDFIAQEYWINNRPLMVKNYLPNADVYVAEQENVILGFVALIDNHMAAIFVDDKQQGKGIGSSLLKHVKKLRTSLTLNVYQKNEESVLFYKSRNFTITSETVDEPTGEKEFIMQWNNECNINSEDH